MVNASHSDEATQTRTLVMAAIWAWINSRPSPTTRESHWTSSARPMPSCSARGKIPTSLPPKPRELEVEEVVEQAEATPQDDACELCPRSIVEAILFVGHPKNEPMTAEQIAALMRGVPAREIDELVSELNQAYLETRPCLSRRVRGRRVPPGTARGVLVDAERLLRAGAGGTAVPGRRRRAGHRRLPARTHASRDR